MVSRVSLSRRVEKARRMLDDVPESGSGEEMLNYFEKKDVETRRREAQLYSNIEKYLSEERQRVEEKVARVERQLEALPQLRSQMLEVESSLGTMERRLDNVPRTFAIDQVIGLSERFERIENEANAQQKLVKAQSATVTNLEKSRDDGLERSLREVAQMRMRLDEIESKPVPKAVEMGAIIELVEKAKEDCGDILKRELEKKANAEDLEVRIEERYSEILKYLQTAIITKA